jgi:hypothetical protein
MSIKFYPLYGGAYMSAKSLDANKIHAVAVAADGTLVKILCGRPKLENVCYDSGEDFTAPTCPLCATRLANLRKREAKQAAK